MPDLTGIVTAFWPHNEDYPERLQEQAALERQQEEKRIKAAAEAEALLHQEPFGVTVDIVV